ncbi:MAG: hypothetical protein AAGE52_13960 [Myxococcota bacterium]
MRGWLVLGALTVAVSGCFDNGARVGLYEACGDTSDCAGTATCFTVAFERDRDGAMCTINCEDDRECPGNAACFALVGDPVDQNVCFERCVDDLDCPLNFVCANAERDGVVVDAICLPE